MLKIATAAFLALAISQNALAAPIKVRVDFVEALAPRDTTSSERFQMHYEGTISLGKSLLKSKLASCGYELDTTTHFYEASDALRAKEIANKANEDGAWLIVGPRRSNHYLLLAQGSASTPSISLMASADEVAKLGPSHTSLSPSNSEMAKIAAKELKARAGKAATYITVFSDDCTACVDFAKAFKASATKFGITNLSELPVQGETFDVGPIKSAIIEKKPAAVILPNYSKVAARVMAAFNDSSYKPLFIGGDGWGDQRYGFVQSGAGIDQIKGITVRGFPPAEQGLQKFKLGKEALSQKSEFPFSGPGLGILKVMDETADYLCKSRPKTREAFQSHFQTISSSRLHSPWGVSVYQLNAGETTFLKTVGVK